MLFRPSFCAHCGEKIERANWGLLTSRRFCVVCESEFKGLDMIPRVIVSGGVLLAVLGLGSYWKSGSSSNTAFVSAARRQDPVPQQVPRPAQTQRPVETQAIEPQPPPLRSLMQPSPQPTPGDERQEPVYFCGARTKKGTPCSRRVKGNNRCFQHLGSEAMLASDKLKVR